MKFKFVPRCISVHNFVAFTQVFNVFFSIILDKIQDP